MIELLESQMPYKRSQALEQRLQHLVGLLRAGRYSTPTLAEELSISQPTVSRCLTALRERGYCIKAIKDESGWSYRLSSDPASFASKSAL